MRVFQIGLLWEDARAIADLFRDSGLRVACFDNGRIALQLEATRAAGAPALGPYSGARVLTGLSCYHVPGLPLIESIDLAETIADAFPDDLLLMSDAPLDAILAERRSPLSKQNLTFQQMLDLQYGPGVRWTRRYMIRAMERYEAIRDRLAARGNALVLPEDRAGAAEVLATLAGRLGIAPPAGTLPARKSRKVPAMEQPSTEADPAFCARIAEHCLAGVEGEIAGDPSPAFSDAFCAHDGAGRVLSRRGTTVPVGFVRERHYPFVGGTEARSFNRPIKCLNELWAAGMRDPVEIDMQDARTIGTPDGGVPGRPVVAYNRRPGARNVALWPLAGFHTPGMATFGGGPPDSRPFERKRDRVVWRGALNGWPNAALYDTGRHRVPSFMLLEQLVAGKPDDDGEVLRMLRGLTRYSVVERAAGREDFDVGFVFPPRLTPPPIYSHPYLRGMIRPYLAMTRQHESRYILSLSGYDTGSNFIAAANSNSVVLKEEDGWELFYTACFRPWEHYIPLSLGALDLDEKLEWARANPAECVAIAGRAREMCRNVTGFANRWAYLGMIAEGLRGRG